MEIKNKFKFGKRSIENLNTCSPLLRALMIYSIATSDIDFAIICGHRGKEDQNEAYYSKPQRSLLKFPNSKHNALPSNAVDIAPYPVDWDDICSFNALADHIKRIARFLNIPIIWGGDWISFKDRPHYQLK